MPAPKKVDNKWESSSRPSSSSPKSPHGTKVKRSRKSRHKNKENISEDKDLAEQLQKVNDKIFIPSRVLISKL